MFFVFLILWIILNGRITPEIVLLGLVLDVPVYLFYCLVMKFSPKKEWGLIKRIPWYIKYLFVLLIEIIKANFAVIRLILSDRLEPEPVLLHFRKPLKNELNAVLLANSITLTPGTITVSLDDGKYVVHALDVELAEGIEDSVFVHMLEELEAKQ